MFPNRLRLILRMKKLILITTAIIGTATASQAGVHFSFGLNVPFPGEIVIGNGTPVTYAPPPQVISQAPVVYQPVSAPIYAPAPVYIPSVPVVARPVYCAPAAPVCAPQWVVAPRPRSWHPAHASHYIAHGREHWEHGGYGQKGGWH